MIIDCKTTGKLATLQPCIYKYDGVGLSRLQGLKMIGHVNTFVEVIALTDDGYVLTKAPARIAGDVEQGLQRLKFLWNGVGVVTPEYRPSSVTRDYYNETVAEPYAVNSGGLAALKYWYEKTELSVGKKVITLHGACEIGHITGYGYWLAPSVAFLPDEAEVDGGGLLRCFFDDRTGPSDKASILKFLHAEKLDLNLCAYYLVAQTGRIFDSYELVQNLEQRMEEVR
jgi:hypothetical protein